MATVMAAVGALLVSSGISLMATAGPSTAVGDDCVPRDAYVETTGWVSQSPGAGWTQVESRVRTPATAGHWADLVWHNYTGNDPVGTPSLDDPHWHALPADPQAENHTVPPRVPNVPYNVSTGASGNGSWFLWTGTWVPAGDTVYEYRFAFEHPAVTCGADAYADVQWIEPSCGTKAGFDTSSGDPVDVTWSDPSAAPAPGVTVTLTATALPGYSFDGVPTKGFTHTYAQVVAPQGQTYDPQAGTCQLVVPPVVNPPTEVSPPKVPVVAPTTAKAEVSVPTVVSAGAAGGVAGGAGADVTAGLGLALAGLLVMVGAGALTTLAGGRRRDVTA